MNRDIKFRVFDKKLNEMHDNLKLYEIAEDDLWYDGETDMWGVFYDGCNEQEQFVVMQYTGLKDKNGKEIYEGDILKVYFDVSKIEDNIYLSLNEEERKKEYFLKKVEIPEFYTEPLSDNFEIIGNIYESEVTDGQ